MTNQYPDISVEALPMDCPGANPGEWKGWNEAFDVDPESEDGKRKILQDALDRLRLEGRGNVVLLV